MNPTNVRLLLSIAGISFLLNLVWENTQAPLYEGYQSFWQHFLICLKATLGDVFIVLVMYGALALFTKDRLWVQHMSATIMTATVLMGIGIAIIIESVALATGRWSYNGMLLIPLLRVGILPVLQMAITPLLTFYTLSKLTRSV